MVHRVQEQILLFFCKKEAEIIIGFNLCCEYKNDINYSSDLNRYSFLRTECLKNPTSYLQRLDEKKYRIWTVVPQEHSW